MKLKTAVGAAFLALIFAPGAALALDTASRPLVSEPQKNFATEYGRALPPVGFVKFCVSNPEDCQPVGGQPNRLDMDPGRWSLLYQVNTYVNGKVTPVSDQELYGEPEHWAYPTDAGDCEDYLLLKKRYLEGLGFPPEALLITVVLDEKKEGHAVLTVTTAGGDFVLDNRRNEILRWSDTHYTYLKRQSPSDPRQWVALMKEKTNTSGFIAGGTSE
jgi:predicted transglutaminase-like cysteine proteinase